MTPEVEDKILDTIRLGLHGDRAAAAHGVTPASYRSHKRRHPSFATRVKEAEASAESGFLSRLLRHTETQWTACAWMLERRWPERWAKRDVVQVGDKGDARKLLEAVQQMRQVTAPEPPKEGDGADAAE